jgi:hypothetical protein
VSTVELYNIVNDLLLEPGMDKSKILKSILECYGVYKWGKK